MTGYNKQKVTLDINKIKRNVSIDENGCWNWNGCLTSSGYGQLTENTKYWATHRYAYTCVIGDIPEGNVVRHMCHNPSCCNPDHLKAGTHKDNWNDSKHVHERNFERQGNPCEVAGVRYRSLRDAARQTGINYETICKYMKDNVFDVDAYREGCKIAAWTPKV